MKRSLSVAALAVFIVASTGGNANATNRPVTAPFVGGVLGGVFTRACTDIINDASGGSNAGLMMIVGGESSPVAQTSISKTAVRSERSDGSSDLTVTLAGPFGTKATTLLALDCAWLDTIPNGVLDSTELVRPYLSPLLKVQGTGINRYVSFSINIPRAAEATVCDRAAGVGFGHRRATTKAVTPLAATSRTNQQPLFAGLSNTLCLAAQPQPVVPEVPLVPALAVSALGLFAFAMRRTTMRTG